MKRKPSITSVKNPHVRQFQEAAVGKRPGEMVADGIKLLWEAVRSDVPIKVAAVSPKMEEAKSGRDLRRRLEQKADIFLDCHDDVIAKMSSLKTPQGGLAILARPEFGLDDLLTSEKATLITCAGGVKDPGNLGAIARTSEAAGATGFLSLQGSADPFRDKAIRGASGTFLRLPSIGGVTVEDLLSFTRAKGLQLVVADGNATSDYLEVDWKKPSLLVVGGEGPGVPEELIAGADQLVKIPMCDPVESLNVAVAAGILLFEARRQRG